MNCATQSYFTIHELGQFLHQDQEKSGFQPEHMDAACVRALSVKARKRGAYCKK